MYSKPQRSRPERAQDIVGKLLCLHSKPTAVTANKGIDIAGKLLIFWFCQQFNSITANEGTDITGKLLFFHSKLNGCRATRALTLRAS